MTLTSLGLTFPQAVEQDALVIKSMDSGVRAGVGHHYPVHERPGGIEVRSADWNQRAGVLSQLLLLCDLG